MIVATAGHVDHGKTELIKAITGIDTDRLPEEKKRGLSIDLGFAYYRLTNGTRLGFVDVPGHEKFIRNMLAGVAGIDLGLLVVAADDGVMPQTIEHLSILSLLGINNCVVALTKIDRTSAERRLEVEKEIIRLLKKFEFVDCELYSVCAPQNIGIEALRNGLTQRANKSVFKDPDQYFRMSIDRAFSLNGIGLVVTGMIFSGSVHISDKLTLSSNDMTVRVREIRANNQVADKAKVGERCALNITGRGISERSIKRGTWLTHPNLNVSTRRIDVDLKILETESNSLKHWTPAHLHIGSDHLSVRVAVLSGGNIPIGKSSLAQLVLPRDIHAVYGDRFVLRDQSAQRTIGGGRVELAVDRKEHIRPRRFGQKSAMIVHHCVVVAFLLRLVLRQGADHVETGGFGMNRRRFGRRALPVRDREANSAHLGFRREIARPVPGRDCNMDRVVLSRDTHHLAATPGNRPDVSVDNAVGGHHVIACLFENFIGPRNLEPQDLCGPEQPVAMLTCLVDRAAITAFTFKHAAGVMQAMGQDMNLSVAPVDELAIEPDLAVTVVKRDQISHGGSPLRRRHRVAW